MMSVCCVLLLLVLVVTVAGAHVHVPDTLRTAGEWWSVCLSDMVHEKSDVDPSTWQYPLSMLPKAPPVTLINKLEPSCAAYGYFNDDIETTGWSDLHVESNAGMPDYLQMYAAGYLEGYLTQRRIYQNTVNVFNATFNPPGVPPLVQQWIINQTEYNAAMLVATDGVNHPNWWFQVILSLQQLQGVYDGYMTVAPSSQRLTPLDILILNLNAEVGDIQLATYPAQRVDFAHLNNIHKVKSILDKRSHCSALIRLTKAGELFTAHTTWTEYSMMLRTYKYYYLPLATSNNPVVHFSSYPGVLSSIDDYYQVLPSKLVVTETTNSVANDTLYDYVHWASVSVWQRVIVANRLAKNGPEWRTHFSYNNSGTYCNQFMVVDYKLFDTNSTSLQPNTAVIVSQAPGLIMYKDVSDVINQQGYWPSYNIPYFPNLWDLFGYASLVQQYGSEGEYLWSYDKSFRAEIFRREAPQVQSLADMKRLMQLNKWQTDPLSKKSPDLAIASRMDIKSDWAPLEYGASGAIDSKITSSVWMHGGKVHVTASSGPTHDDQQPFEWTSAWNNISHIGLPYRWAFGFVEFEGTHVQTTQHKDTPVVALQ